MNVDDHDVSDPAGRADSLAPGPSSSIRRAFYAIVVLAITVPLWFGGSRLIERRASNDDGPPTAPAPNIVPEALASNDPPVIVAEVGPPPLAADPGPGVHFRIRDASLGAGTGYGTLLPTPPEVTVQTDDAPPVLPEPGPDLVVRDPTSSETLAVAGQGPTSTVEAAIELEQNPLAWFVFDDRGLYKPGQQARIKGWLRPIDWQTGGGVLPPDADVTALDYRVTAADDVEFATGSIEVSPAGGFDLAVDLPADMRPGRARLTLSVHGDAPYGAASYTHGVEVAEFRLPGLQVSATSPEPYYFIGDTAYADVQASGSVESLAGGRTRWQVSAEPITYAPPGHDEFSFGHWIPSWTETALADVSQTRHELGSATDSDGRHRLAIEVEAVEPRAPARFRADVSVGDVRGELAAGSTDFLVHPARYYVGLRTDSWFGETSTLFAIEAIVADLGGDLIGDTPIEVTAERVSSVARGAGNVEDAIQAGTCALVSESRPAVCTFAFDQVGRYRITAAIRDPEGRDNATEIQLVVGGRDALPFGGIAGLDTIEMIPEKGTYAPGDTARILILAPFAPSEGRILARRSGLLRTWDFRMEAPFGVVEVPIAEDMLPNFLLGVDLAPPVVGDIGVDDADAPLPVVPEAARGEIQLMVPSRSRTLSVTATPREAVPAPGTRTRVDVSVRDAAGNPVAGAEVALVVVDESVLALTGYQFSDPVRAFYPDLGAGVDESRLEGASGDGTETVVVSDERFRPAMGAGPGVPSVQGVDPAILRPSFEPVALFAPRLIADGAGLVSAEFTLPNSVTRYRVIALATDGRRAFGKGEGTLTARMPLSPLEGRE